MIAFRLAYKGLGYRGFDCNTPNLLTKILLQNPQFKSQKSSSGGVNDILTVEHAFLNALVKTKLITSTSSSCLSWKKELNYAKSARTDMGVSSACTVVSLNINANSPSCTNDPPPNYLVMLNHNLPPDIRVTGYAFPTSKSFNARHDCLWREYEFYFDNIHKLNLNAMATAARYLEGRRKYSRIILQKKTHPVSF